LLNSSAGVFEGMLRYEARVEIERALEKKGLIRGKESNKMRLGICSRSGDIIEPYLTPQWYVKCEEMAAKAVAEVKEGRLRIEPAVHIKTWYHWLENARDWCVSRQLWWGHQIPAYFIKKRGENISHSDPGNNDRWFVARSKESALNEASEKLQTPVEELDAEQDSDVLDTWFSSGLFPFSTLGWPEETDDFKAFYPNTLLETGMDILFFWVARMVMLGLELTEKLPFKTVFLHPMVRDKYGRKMSKSLGNVVDPLGVICGCTLGSLLSKLEMGNLPKKEVETAKKAQKADFPEGIPECGTDALRFGLLAYMIQGNNINLDLNRVVGYRNFCNKLWNATRFALTYVTEVKPSMNMAQMLIESGERAPRDRWIMSRLNRAIAETNRCFGDYDFSGATTSLYHFWLYELCDHYLELIKPVVNDKSESNAKSRRAAQGCLYLCLDFGLKLLHPIMPFVTEDLWQRLPGRGTLGPNEPSSIMIAKYPTTYEAMNDVEAEENYELVKTAIHTARSLRADYNLTPQVRPTFYIRLGSKKLAEVMKNQLEDFSTLAKAGEAKVLEEGENPPKGCAIHIASTELTVFILLAGLVDFEAEIEKLEKQKAQKICPSIEGIVKRRNAEGYTSKVPEAIRQADEQRLEELNAQKLGIESAIRNFEAMC